MNHVTGVAYLVYVASLYDASQMLEHETMFAFINVVGVDVVECSFGFDAIASHLSVCSAAFVKHDSLQLE